MENNEVLLKNCGEELNKIWGPFLFDCSLETSTSSFEVWIKTLTPVKIDDNVLYVATPSQSSKNILDRNYKTILEKNIKKQNPHINCIEIILEEEIKFFADTLDKKEQEDEDFNKRMADFEFNPKYTFDNYVVGKSNEFTAAAAKAVAENPGKKYNPLFIYGGVGLGKTHLLHAIGNHIRETKPELKVIYVTIEKFMNDLIESIQGNKKSASFDFRNKYRFADVLIVDDIQFITSKTATQEEFFHTFNQLNQSGKQIIISSDKPPKSIDVLEERLRSRFEWGLITDIGFPDLETRIAILNKKAQMEKYNVSSEVINYIASAIKTNIREMEGLLSRAVFYTSLCGNGEVTLELATEALKNYLHVDEEDVKTDNIIDNVCKYFSITKSDLKAKKRTKEIANARQICMYLICELVNMPLASVGAIFGKDHATVIYAKSKVAEDMKKNKKVETQINDLLNLIKCK